MPDDRGKDRDTATTAALGVVVPLEKGAQAATGRPSRRTGGPKGWLNYQRCVENTPQARGNDRPDISRVDFTFCLLAIDWGWSVEGTAARLMQESGKARENSEAYALRTAQRAAAALDRRHGPHR